MNIFKPLAALSIGALLGATLAAPAHAGTFGPTPYFLADVDPGGGVAIGSRVVFSGSPLSGDRELWITDGTPKGTKVLKDINPGVNGSFPGPFVAFKGKVFFPAQDPVGGVELWSTDGTTSGTRRVSDINPPSFAGAITQLTVAGSRLYFTARTSETGLELWSTDGTAGNTDLVLDIQTGQGSSLPAALTPFNGGLAFSAHDANGVRRPWATRGTAATTHLLDGGPAGIVTEVADIVALGSNIVFSAANGAGRELWRSTGEPFSTAQIKDIYPGATSSTPRGLVKLGDTVYFRAVSPDDGIELWSTDGTRGGTQQVRDIREGAQSSQPDYPIVAGDAVYFVADDGMHGIELWLSRGRASTTRLTKDIDPGVAHSVPSDMRFVGGKVVFAASDPVHGRELWSTDGTSDGTHLTSDLAPGAGSTNPEPFGQLGSTVLFDAQVGGAHQLWAYTAKGSSTRAYPRSSYSRKDGSKKRIRITVQVSAPGTTPVGTVALRWGSKTIGTGTLSGGVAKVKITSKLGKGPHTVKAYYLGSTRAQVSTSTAFNVRVR